MWSLYFCRIWYFVWCSGTDFVVVAVIVDVVVVVMAIGVLMILHAAVTTGEDRWGTCWKSEGGRVHAALALREELRSLVYFHFLAGMRSTSSSCLLVTLR